MTLAPPVPASLWTHGPPSLDDGSAPWQASTSSDPSPTGPAPQAAQDAARAADSSSEDAPAPPAQTAGPSGVPRAQLEIAVRAAQAGSLEAFDRLVEWFAPRILDYLRQLTRNPHDAQDLTQETFLKAYRGLANFDPRRSFLGWILTIARRTAISSFRGRRPVPVPAPESLTLETDHRTPAALLATKDDGRSLWALADRLKPRQREALWLHYGEDLPIDECARVMGLTRIHVKVLLHRGRLALAKRLRDAGPQAIWFNS